MRKLLFIAAVLAATACTSTKNDSNDVGATADSTVVQAIPKEELMLKINQNNAALTNLYSPDSLRFICRGQADLCEMFVKSYPLDPEAPKVLSYEAKALRVLGQSKEAVAVYNKIEQSYADYPDMPEVLFLKAFILDEDLNDKKKAELAYLDLIQKYPNHKFSKDAKALLTQLHMSDEDLIKMFEEKNSGSK